MQFNILPRFLFFVKRFFLFFLIFFKLFGKTKKYLNFFKLFFKKLLQFVRNYGNISVVWTNARHTLSGAVA